MKKRKTYLLNMSARSATRSVIFTGCTPATGKKSIHLKAKKGRKIMAVKKAAKKEEAKKSSFKEFKFTGKTFEYTGRVFPSKEGSGKVKRKWGLTLCLNGVFSLKGCQLVETDSNVFITYPQYFVKGKTDNDGTWNSYVYVDKELNDELDAFVNYLMAVVGIDGNDTVKDDGIKDEDLPF